MTRLGRALLVAVLVVADLVVAVLVVADLYGKCWQDWGKVLVKKTSLKLFGETLMEIELV